MKKIFKTTMFVYACLLAPLSTDAFATYTIVAPQNLPYTYNGHTYTDVISVYWNSQGYTKILYYNPTDLTNLRLDYRGGGYSYFVGDSEANMLYRVYSQQTLTYELQGGLGFAIPINANSTLDSDYVISSQNVLAYQTENFNGYQGLGGVSQDEILMSPNWTSGYLPPETPFGFPLSGYTPYTAPVSSVMDQSTLGDGIAYSDSDHQVVAFNGEASDEVNPYSGSTCYGESNNTAFGNDFNYVGTSGTGGSYYLCYNGHPGYDYPVTLETSINAPADGTLCVATTYVTQRSPSDVWRNTSECQLPSEVDTRWLDSGGYNTFYIIHEGLYINGSTNDYMTVFLHSDDLESSVRADIEQNGYAQITKGDHIAQVGNVGTNGYHVHFEVYKRNGSLWDRVDPYGDGTNDILWE